MDLAFHKTGSFYKAAWGIGLGLATLMWANHGRAQANFDEVNLGGRTTMMGGAGVARGADGATAFMNPANITRIPGEQFSFSTFAVSVGAHQIYGSIDPGGQLQLRNPNSNDLDVNIIPNTFCLFLDGPPRDNYSGKSRHKYGVCAADTEREAFFVSANRLNNVPGEGLAATSQITTLRFARSTLALAWGLELMPGTAIGVTLKAENSRLEDQTSATAFSNFSEGAMMQTLTHARKSSSWDSAILIGLSHEVSRRVTLGAAFTTPSLHLIGFHTGVESLIPEEGGSRSLIQDDGDFSYNQSGHLRLGLAFAWPRLNLEINGSFYGAQRSLAQATFDRRIVTTDGDEAQVQSTRGSITERGKPVVNLLAGAEYFLQNDFSVIAGVQSDFSGLHPRQDARPADTLFRQSKDAVHASLGVASYGAAGSLLLGFRTSYAWGEVLFADAARSAPTFVALPQTEWNVSLIVSGQISFEAVRDTALRAAEPLKTIPKVLDEPGDEDEDHGDEDESPGEDG